MSQRTTFRDIVQSQDRGGQKAPFLFWFAARFIAWPLTYGAARLGMTPNGATSLRLFLTLLCFALILSEDTRLYLVGLCGVFLAIVMDNVDGQLARIQNRASFFGKYYDGLADSVIEAGLPIMMGLHFLLVRDDSAALLFGLLAGASHGMVQLIMVRYGLMFEKYQAAGAPAPNAHRIMRRMVATKLWRGLSWVFEQYLPNLLWDIRFGGLAIAILTGLDREYLIVLGLCEAGMTLGFAFFRLLRAYLEMDAHRYSATHGTRPPE